jgi:nicotinate phosphoribosyltransferase
VFASGGLDEAEIARLVEAGAAVDGFGVGTKMGVSADAPFLDLVYKLVEIDGRPVLKLSPGKATLPGRKQVWRIRKDGLAAHDVLGLAGSSGDGEPLLHEVMRDGRATWSEPLVESRERARRERESLPDGVRALAAGPYEVVVGADVAALRDRLSAGAV